MLTTMPHKSKDLFVRQESVVTEGVIAKSALRFEMDDLKTMKTDIKSRWQKSDDESGIYLKQELELTRLSIDSNNAGTGCERQQVSSSSAISCIGSHLLERTDSP